MNEYTYISSALNVVNAIFDFPRSAVDNALANHCCDLSSIPMIDSVWM
jgi:hypothetical protein